MLVKMQEEVFDDEQELKISDYNSALFINKRLNDLWEDANKHKRRGAYSDWNGDLDAVWCELAGDVPEGEINKDTKEFELNVDEKKYILITRELGKLTPLMNWGSKSGFNASIPQQILLKTKQYKVLMDKEIFLRRLMNRQGKGTKYRDNMDDYMMG